MQAQRERDEARIEADQNASQLSEQGKRLILIRQESAEVRDILMRVRYIVRDVYVANRQEAAKVRDILVRV